MPKFWDGIDFLGWVRLLARNRFAIDWRLIPTAVIITLVSIVHTLLSAWQKLVRGWWLSKVRIDHPPLFIIGHWRAGTTYLHELLVRDARHAYPTTYQCFVPHHFVISEKFAYRCLSFLLPSQRPMDNMPAGWERPQEDEFALCNLGVPSPYLTIAFPNRGPQYTEYLTLEGVPEKAVQRWKRALWEFLRQISYRNPKRIVLKSPPHTCRVDVLLEMFPDARFVHIVRDPYTVFPSTVNLWKRLYEQHALQRPTFAGLEEYVFDTFQRMYEKFERDRELIRPDRFCEVRYEELVRDPIGQVRAIYERLDLGDFEPALPALEEYVASVADYQTNHYQLTPETRDEIGRRWGDFIRKYGYDAPANGRQASD